MELVPGGYSLGMVICLKMIDMKKLILLFGLSVALFGCSKGSDEDPTIEINPSVEEENTIAKKCKEYGIYPTGMNAITEINFIRDSISYKLAGGAKGNKSWLAKFKPDGSEIFSYSLDPSIGQKETANNTTTSLWGLWSNDSKLFCDNGKLFVITWFRNKEDASITSENYNSVLSVLDFNTGKELSKLPYQVSVDNYQITPSNGFYYVLSKSSQKIAFEHLFSLNKDGSLAWGREVLENEKTNGISSYTDFQALDSELMLYFYLKPVDDHLEETVRVINLKTSEVNMEINQSDIPFTGELESQSGISYKFTKASKDGEEIKICFGEYENDKLKNEYCYVVLYPSGEVKSKSKI